MRKLMLILMVIGLIGSAQALDVFNYDFDSLTVGAIDGQDGWTTTSGNVIDLGGGDLALQVPSGTSYTQLSNAFVLTEEMDAVQADFRYFTGAINVTNRLYLSGTDSKKTPFYGFNGGDFEVRHVKQNGTNFDTAFRVDVPATFDSGDWVTIRMTFDAANKTATMSYKNLTDGETVFTDIPALSGDLGFSDITDMSAYLKAFTSLTVRCDGGNSLRAIDNIVIPDLPARGQAHTPDPDGSVLVPTDVTAVTWMSPDNPEDPNLTVTGYDVYIYGTSAVTSDDPNFVGVSAAARTTESLPVMLGNEMTYFWRVDSNVTWDSNDITGALTETIPGVVWSFETEPADLSPVVDAGPEVITAPELGAATVAGTVDDLGENDLISVVWSVETAPAGSVHVLTPGGTDLAPTASLSDLSVGDYTLRLTATDATGDVYDETIVSVEADACAAAVASGIAKNVLDVAPAGGDCEINLLDFAEMAADWLENISLTAQEPQLP